MSAISDVLNEKERKTLGRLALASGLVLALGLLLVVRQRSGLRDAQDTLAKSEENRAKTEKALAEAKTQWQRWQEAARDLQAFRTSYFYGAQDVFQSLRLDLQRIFNDAGMSVPQIGYGYGDMTKSRLGKVVATFNFTGSYAALKKFLVIVERFPKFLCIEKMDFLDTGVESGALRLKIAMAGYYEE